MRDLRRKKKAVEMAVSRFYEEYPEYRNGTKEQYESGELSAVTVLAELGGFDLAGMTGLFLGGAAAKIPVLMDGFLSTVSGLLAVLIRKEAKDYMLASHISTEPAGGGDPSDAGSSGTSSHGNASRRGKRGGCHDPASQDGCKGI